MIEGIDQTGGENSDKENKHSDFLSNTFLEFVQISAISKKKRFGTGTKHIEIF